MSLSEASARAASAYNAAADFSDSEPLSFWDYFGRRTIERLNLKPGARVVDVACGSGASAIPAATLVGTDGEVLALDVAESLLALGRRKSTHLPQLRFECADFHAVDVEPGSRGFVVCVFGIFFMPDMASALRRMWSWLRVGGLLGITTWGERMWEPGSSALWDAIRETRPDLLRTYNPWDRISTIMGFRSLFTDAGITNVRIQTETRLHTLKTPDDWWAIVMGSGYRGTVEQLTSTEREKVRKHCLKILADYNISGIEMNVHYAVAEKRAQ